ncbi:glycerate kinase [Amycolatopsis endophytica]|uniref:Glycerate kinase n=1 Tax=Amycolatopsis endophytica TaxID=860233 RepID=A0A853B8B7_9PSEU|nr:glycerate kinase [Amycolatopsis endophytica]NYI91563.1 glycerate kinase [Amycolatopsis endophytica]
MRVLVSMDKLKGTATAAEACAAVSRGLRRAEPGLDVRELPMADGGDGTLDALLHGGYDHDTLVVPAADGRPESARVARRDGTYLVEIAEICGLGGARPTAGMAERADSSGVGDAIRHALDAGAGEIQVGLGGSATSDGGAGMLRRLGARFLDRAGQPLAAGGSALAELAELDWSGLDPRLASIRLLGLCDVDSPLLGASGAAEVFGPQKGADPAAVHRIEAGLSRFAQVVARTPPPAGFADPNAAGAGAAGGLGWGLRLLGAELAGGGERIADALGLDAATSGADLVITGEGRLDRQSLAGKTPAVVAGVARHHRVPVAAVVGQDRLGEEAARLGLVRVVALERIAGPTVGDRDRTIRALEQAGTLLAATVAQAQRDAPAR